MPRIATLLFTDASGINVRNYPFSIKRAIMDAAQMLHRTPGCDVPREFWRRFGGVGDVRGGGGIRFVRLMSQKIAKIK